MDKDTTNKIHLPFKGEIEVGQIMGMTSLHKIGSTHYRIERLLQMAPHPMIGIMSEFQIDQVGPIITMLPKMVQTPTREWSQSIQQTTSYESRQPRVGFSQTQSRYKETGRTKRGTRRGRPIQSKKKGARSGDL